MEYKVKKCLLCGKRMKVGGNSQKYHKVCAEAVKRHKSSKFSREYEQKRQEAWNNLDEIKKEELIFLASKKFLEKGEERNDKSNS